jgi:hypothetical protein
MAQAADFFISYTSADRAWAEWIAWQLEAEGYKVVVQAWDFAPGHDWAHEMQRAAATAERVVAVLSPAYFRSAHGEAEWRTFYTQDPSGEQRRLLPVRVGQVEPAGLLKTRIYVDLVDQDAAGARATLLAAARGTRGKPTSEPGFPGMPGHSMGSETRAPRFPGEPENRVPNESGVQRWVWPRDRRSTETPHAFRAPAGTITWPIPPPVDEVRAVLLRWARQQRSLPPSVFEGELTVHDTSIVQLQVTAAFDERQEAWRELRPGPILGQPEIYDGSLQHARLSIDRGERRWQNTSDWWGVRRGWREQQCLACDKGKVACPACKGSGKIENRAAGTCGQCNGQRFALIAVVRPGSGTTYKYDRCPTCSGSGIESPTKVPCSNSNCSEGQVNCPKCLGHRYFLSFFWGIVRRKVVQFRIIVTDNRDLRRVKRHYELVGSMAGWPDLSSLPQQVQLDAKDRLERSLVQRRNRTLGQNSVVYHLQTQVLILPAIQVPYEGGLKRAYLIGRHCEVYTPDEKRPEVRLTRAWASAQISLRAWLDRSPFPVWRAWPILATAVFAFIGVWCGIALR